MRAVVSTLGLAAAAFASGWPGRSFATAVAGLVGVASFDMAAAMAGFAGDASIVLATASLPGAPNSDFIAGALLSGAGTAARPGLACILM